MNNFLNAHVQHKAVHIPGLKTHMFRYLGEHLVVLIVFAVFTCVTEMQFTHLSLELNFHVRVPYGSQACLCVRMSQSLKCRCDCHAYAEV